MEREREAEKETNSAFACKNNTRVGKKEREGIKWKRNGKEDDGRMNGDS
jgi:hypothetical protein